LKELITVLLKLILYLMEVPRDNSVFTMLNPNFLDPHLLQIQMMLATDSQIVDVKNTQQIMQFPVKQPTRVIN
jgi:hypothetical protein